MTGFTTEFESALHNYWQYYRELEDDFLQTQKFVSFNERNFHTFSIEFLKLFQAACSEVETLAKALALLIDPNFDQQNANIKSGGLPYRMRISITLKRRIVIPVPIVAVP